MISLLLNGMNSSSGYHDNISSAVGGKHAITDEVIASVTIVGSFRRTRNKQTMKKVIRNLARENCKVEGTLWIG